MSNLNSNIDFIKKSPKTELHLHIEGSLEPELMFKLSKKNKIEIPFKTVEEIRSAYSFSNLDSFLKIYYEGTNVLIQEEDFFDLTWEYISRCKQDNIVHTEIFFDPQSHLSRGVSFKTVINGIDKALKKAEKDFGISSKIIMCFLRHLEEEPCFDVLKQACDHKDKIIGVGLDSSEKGNPPAKFKRLFERAMKEGFITGRVLSIQEIGKNVKIFQPFDHSNILRKTDKLFAEVNPNDRVYAAFKDPQNKYFNMFDGYRVLHEINLLLASEKGFNLIPDFWAVSETNEIGSTDIFGNDLVYNTDSVNHENGLLVTNGFVHEKIVSKISELK